MKIIVALMALMLAGCSDPPPHASDGASVARICRDGSHIFKYRDGTYHTSWGYLVEDIDKVCQP
jgi:hypothetical protein